jgi:transposase-like protein
MDDMNANIKPAAVVIEAVVIRADGTREDLGAICDTRKNKPKRKSIFQLLKQKGDK